MATRHDPNSSARGSSSRAARTGSSRRSSASSGTGPPRRDGTSTRARRTPAKLWQRRILTGGALLLVLVILAWGVVSIATRAAESAQSGVQESSSAATQSGSQSGGSAQTTDNRYPQSAIGPDGSVDGSSKKTGPVTVPTCEPGDLGATVAVTGGSVAVGAGATFSLTVEDTSNIQCATALGQMSVKVVSGDQTIYDSTSCPDRDTTITPLLLTPGASWTGTLTWSGDVYDGCTALDTNGDGTAAGAGTYRVQVLLDGKKLGDEQVFEVR